MRKRAGWWLMSVFVSVGLGTQDAQAIDVYHVGNSLTWDSQPASIRNFAQSQGESHSYGVHIRSNSSLTQILLDPTSTNVPTTSHGTFEPGLSQNTWDAVTIQPYPNSIATMKGETDAILSMIETTRSNPGNANTKFYIYTGWSTRSALLGSWEDEAGNEDDDLFSISRAAYQHVYDRVTDATDAEVYMIPVGEIIYQLAQAIEDGDIDGLTSYRQLYRDEFHMGYGVGRHVASATTFSTLYGDDLSDISFGNLSSAANASINALIWDEISSNSFTGVPEPGVGLSVLLLTALMGGRSRGVGRSLNH